MVNRFRDWISSTDDRDLVPMGKVDLILFYAILLLVMIIAMVEVV